MGQKWIGGQWRVRARSDHCRNVRLLASRAVAGGAHQVAMGGETRSLPSTESSYSHV